MSSNIFSVRNALLLDAVASGATAALMIAGAGILEPLLALPATLMRGAGLVLIPYVAFVAFIATRAQIAPAAVWSVIAANALWTIASFVLVLDGFVTPNAWGTIFVIGQALAVAALGALQYAALRLPRMVLV